jgi:hypothetical protein
MPRNIGFVGVGLMERGMVVISMLADPAAVIEAMEGDAGVLTTIKPGTIVIDSSTISPATTRKAKGPWCTLAGCACFWQQR